METILKILIVLTHTRARAHVMTLIRNACGAIGEPIVTKGAPDQSEHARGSGFWRSGLAQTPKENGPSLGDAPPIQEGPRGKEGNLGPAC